MPDREKVTQSIEACLAEPDSRCKECIYPCTSSSFVELHEDMIKDALALLRKQEPVAPRYKDPYHAYCGACGCRIPLKIKARYCHKCGRKVKWE